MPPDFNNKLSSLSTQSESLQTLEFKYLSFDGIDDRTLYLLCSLKNIRKLKLYDCNRMYYLNSWAKILTKLEVLEIVKEDASISVEFLVQLFEFSSNSLTKLVVNYLSVTAIA